MSTTVADVLAARREQGRELKLYATRSPGGSWVAEDEEHRLWRFPAVSDGWRRREPWTRDAAALLPTEPYNALGTGWPGLEMPQ